MNKSQANLGMLSSTSWVLLTLWSGVLVQAAASINHFLPFEHVLPTTLMASAIALHVIGCLMALVYLVRLFSSIGRAGYFFGILTDLLFVAVLAFAFLPILSRDALIHHLAVPKMWNEFGIIREISWHSWSYYPMLLQQVFAYFLRQGLEGLTVVYHASFLIPLAALLGAWVKSLGKSNMTAVLAVLLCLALPLHIRLASEPMVDLGLAYFFTLGLALCFWRQEEPEQLSITGALLAGVAFGLALSVKYNALLAFACCLPFLFLVLIKSQGFLRGTSLVTLAALTAFALFSPWLLRNFLWTGNPVYPLYQSFFTDVVASEVRTPGALAERFLLYGEDIQHFFAVPMRMILFGQDHSPQYFDGVLIPLLILFPLGFRSRPLLFLGLAMLSYWYASSIFSSGRIRYLAPIIPILLLLSTLGIDLIAGWFKQRARLVLLLSCSVVLIYGFYYLGILAKERQLISFLQGQSTREQYLQDNIPEWPLIKKAELLSGADSTTLLLLTSNRFYYFDSPVISAGHFSGTYVLDLLRSAPTKQELATLLNMRGIATILMHEQRTADFLSNNLTEEKKILWDEFRADYLENIDSMAGFSLYRIRTLAVEHLESQ
jgi:hypothetical protein